MINRIKNAIALRRLGRALRPRRGFKNELWRKLEAELPASAPLWRVRGLPRLARVAVPAFSLLLIFVGTGAYAYASPDVLPNNPLYGVKRGIEKVEAAVALTPKQKNSALVRQLTHRLVEAKKVSKINADYEPLVAEIKRDFSAALDTDANLIQSKKVLSLLEKADNEVLSSIEADSVKNPDKLNGAARELLVNGSQKIAAKLQRVQDPKTRQFLAKRLVEREAVLGRIVKNLRPLTAANASGTLKDATGAPRPAVIPPRPTSLPSKLRPDLDRALLELQRDFDQAINRPSGAASNTEE